ncbi:MAG TPA: cyclic nucleotide-binding domain-containing protein [Candidatus Binatia bacterium]|jgi:CRP-like cAMP-binding protein
MAGWNWRKRIIDKEQLQRLELLENVSLFHGLSQRQLGKLLVKLFEKEYAPGEIIFRQGDAGKAVFIVFAGSVLIVRSTHHGEEELANIKPGGYFGELALIDDQPRSATARTAEGTVLLILYKSDFDDLIEGQRVIAIHVMGNLLKALAGYVRSSRHTSDPAIVEGSVPARKRLG